MARGRARKFVPAYKALVKARQVEPLMNKPFGGIKAGSVLLFSHEIATEALERGA